MEINPDGIRGIQTGYDRTIAIGDMTWPSNYEVTVPFTAHKNFTAIGFAVGWQGHEGSQQPKKGWPLEALAWVRGPKWSPTLEIVRYAGPNLPAIVDVSVSIPPIEVGETYILKTSSEPFNSTTSRFDVKFWKQEDGEPTDWNINADVPTRDGSVLLVAWHADTTFGNVHIEPIAVNEIPVAVATGTPINGDAPLNVNFDGSGSTDDGSITAYVWDFGDGSPVSNQTNPAHTYTVPGNYTATLTVTDNTGQTSTDTVAIAVGGTGNTSGLVSDDFNHPLNTSVWTFFDPKGDSLLSETGTQMALSVPAGADHNLWRNKLFAPRIRQAADDTDFEVDVKFDSALSARFQLQGITVEQDGTNLLRFDFLGDGSKTQIFSASFVKGKPTKRIQSVIASGVPLYLRVKRVGDQWTMSYSYDGVSWIVAGSYTHNLAVTSVGIFGGNAGSALPAHTALIDYFKVNGD